MFEVDEFRQSKSHSAVVAPRVRFTDTASVPCHVISVNEEVVRGLAGGRAVENENVSVWMWVCFTMVLWAILSGQWRWGGVTWPLNG